MSSSTSRRRLLLSCGCCALSALAARAGAQEAAQKAPAPRAQIDAVPAAGARVNPVPQSSTQQDWRSLLLKEQRSLWLIRDDDELRSIYWTAAAGFNRDQYLQICWLMRDKRSGRVFPMDRQLLDVLCGVQTWLARNGYEMPIRINSGYRTMATNRSIEGSARNSQHILGKAADIVVAGVSPLKIAGMASLFGRGGTGFYVGRDFVHVDTADERIWIDQKRRAS